MFVKGVNLCDICAHKSLFDGCTADNNIVNFETEVVIMCDEYKPDCEESEEEAE